MKYKNENGEWKDIYVKASDTLPIGAEVDYDGDDIPAGWEEVKPRTTNRLYVRNSTIELTTTSDNETKTLLLNNVVYKDGDGFTLNSDGTVTIGDGIKKVEVSAMANITNGTSTSTYQRLQIMKNGIMYGAATQSRCDEGYSANNVIPAVPMEVNKGDKIGIAIFNRIKGKVILVYPALILTEIVEYDEYTQNSGETQEEGVI